MNLGPGHSNEDPGDSYLDPYRFALDAEQGILCPVQGTPEYPIHTTIYPGQSNL